MTQWYSVPCQDARYIRHHVAVLAANPQEARTIVCRAGYWMDGDDLTRQSYTGTTAPQAGDTVLSS